VAFIIIVVLPLFIEVYGLHVYEIMIIALQFILLQCLVYTVKKFVNNSILKWLLLSATLLIMILTILHIPAFYGAIITFFVFAVILWYQFWIISSTNRYFYEELAIEQQEKSRYIKMILDFSQEVEKNGGTRKKRPWVLFRRSKQLFSSRKPKHGLAEFLIKGFIRDKPSVLMLFQISGVTSFAIAMTLVLFKWIILICFIFFLHSWLNAVFHKMLGNSFFDVVSYEPSIEDDVWRIFKRFLYYPMIIVLCIFTTVSAVLVVV